jgi:hypothetical protein
MFRPTAKLVLAAVVILALALPVQADDPISNSLKWLKTQQQADGGFTNGFSEGSDLGTTCDVILALAAAGEDPAAWLSDAGNSPLDYLRAQLEGGAVEQVNQKAKIVLALTAAGEDPANFGGHDLLAELSGAYDAASGSFGGNTFDQALVILALAGAGQAVPQGAVQALVDSQAEDGAWALFGDTAAGAGDTNTTALVLQALVAVGEDAGVARALDYLHQVQNEDGGFPYQKPSEYGTDTDANSTAVVLQALKALDEDLSAWAPQGSDPRAALEALYDPSSGAFLWQAAVPGANVLATAQAIPALAGYTFVALPMVGFGGPAPAAEAEGPAPILPATGSAGPGALPLVLLLAGVAALGAGFRLRRRGSARR